MLKHLFSILIFFFIVSNIHAETKNYVLLHYGTNRLSQSTIEDLYFDNHDFLWLSTQMGIVRFDGYSFKEFNQLTSTEISCNRFIHSLRFKFLRGDDGSFYEINSHTNSPKRIKKPCFLFKNIIFRNKLNLENYVRELKLNYGNNAAQLLEFNKNNLFYPISKNKCFLITKKNIFFINKTFKKKLYNFPSLDFAYTQIGEFLRFDNDNKTIYFSEKGKIELSEFITGIDFDDKNVKIQFFKTNTGHYFLYTKNSLYQLRKLKDKFVSKQIFSDLVIPNVNTFSYNPKQKIYFFGSSTNGLYVIKHNPFNVIKSETLSTNCVMYSTLFINDSDVLLSQGIKKTITTGKESWFHDNTGYPLILFKDIHNNIWYPDGYKLFRYSSQLKIKQSWDISKLDRSGIGIRKIYEDKKGNIWFNSYTKIHYISKNTLVGNVFPKVKLKNEYIETFSFPFENECWIATSKRLYVYNLKTQKTKILLNKSDVRSLHKDLYGNILIGTYGAGMYLYKDQKIFNVPIDHNNLLNCVHAFLVDKRLNLWISSNNGLFVIPLNSLIKSTIQKKSNLHYIHFSTSDGLPNNEFNGGYDQSGYIHNNRFYFSSMSGLISFNPEFLKLKTRKPKIYIDEIICDGKNQEENKIVLDAEFNRLTVKLSIPYWFNRHNLSVLYQIKEIDKNVWHELSLGEPIRISSLSYGNYEITIKAKNIVGNGEFIKNLRFEVKPKYFETIYFKILISILIGLFVFLLYWLRVKFLLRERNILRKQVNNQLTQLNNTNLELENTLTHLNELNEKLERSNDIRSKLVSIFVHDLKSPLRFLASVTNKVIKNNDLLTKEEVIKIAEDFYQYSVKSMQYIDDFLVWQTVNQDNWSINKKEFNINSVILELVETYEVLCSNNKNKLNFYYQENIKIFEDEELVKIILRNLIDNANKHTYNGTINITVFEQNDIVQVIVEDNGNGLHPSELKLIKKYLTLEKYGKVHEHIGYQIIGDFIKKMNVHINIDSEGPNKGTKVSIIFSKID